MPDTGGSLTQLELLVSLCHQLPEAESERLLRLELDNELQFRAAVAAGHRRGTIRLAERHLPLVYEDISGRATAS